MTGDKKCNNCKSVLPITKFGLSRKSSDGRHSECRQCAVRRAALYRSGPMAGIIKEKSRQRAFARYRMTEADYQELLTAQGGVCAICKRPPDPNGKRLRVDHDQACCRKPKDTCGLCTRGLLCDMCNRGLGYFGDASPTVAIALDYLLRAERRLALLKQAE